MTKSLKQCQSGDRCQPVTGREALYCQVHHSQMRAEDQARRLGISVTTLTQGVDPYGDGSPLAAKHHELLLELTADNLTYVTFLAGKQGAVAFRVPASSVIAQTAGLCSDFGEFLQTVSGAEADGIIRPDEAARTKTDGHEVITAVAALISHVEGRVARPSPVAVRRA